MFYTPEATEGLEQEYQTISGKHSALQELYFSRSYFNDQAREYAHHGFLRRLKTLVRCIERVYELCPLDMPDLPDHERLTDICIHLQSSVFNVYGSIDNLAWILVMETGLTLDNGKPIPANHVGLRKTNKSVRRSLSPVFQSYLEGLEDWFDSLESFRHALAHRIPLYVPPYMMLEENLETYDELQVSKRIALKYHEFETHEELSAQQDALGFFRPVMAHSLKEDGRQVYFHAQILADFNTVEELGGKVLEELDR